MSCPTSNSQTMATTDSYDIIGDTLDIINDVQSANITVDDLNDERIDCLITSFCKQHSSEIDKNIHAMFQLNLIKQYYHDPNQVTPSTFLSYNLYKTNSIEIDKDLRKCTVKDWPDGFVEPAVSEYHVSRECVSFTTITGIILLIIAVCVMSLDPSLVVAVMIFAIICYGRHYSTGLWRKYYVINFNIFDKEIQKWEIKPRILNNEYGSLRFDREFYACQVKNITPICAFKEWKPFYFKQGYTRFQQGDKKLIKAKLSIKHKNGEGKFDLGESINNFNDIPIDAMKIKKIIQNELQPNVMFSVWPFAGLPKTTF